MSMKIKLVSSKAGSSSPAAPVISTTVSSPTTTRKKVTMKNEATQDSGKSIHPIKARLLVGGLKSLFGEMHDMLSDLEKEGRMPKNGIDTLADVKKAIDMTVVELQKITPACCSHDQNRHEDCEECNPTEEEEEPPVTTTLTKKAAPKKLKGLNDALVTGVFDLLRDRWENVSPYDAPAPSFICMCHSLGNSLVAIANLLDRHDHADFPDTGSFDENADDCRLGTVVLSWEDSVVLEVGTEPIKMKKLDAFANDLKKA